MQALVGRSSLKDGKVIVHQQHGELLVDLHRENTDTLVLATMENDPFLTHAEYRIKSEGLRYGSCKGMHTYSAMPYAASLLTRIFGTIP